MKQIKLLALRIENWKGVKNFELLATGKNVTVYGENGAGKTTITDAFMWLLFDKDSQGNTNFEIRPIHSDGEVEHGIESIVHGEIEVNGENKELKKIYKEKWTKQRGSTEKTYSGNETKYYIDEVPVKKGEYKTLIDEILDEKTFKMVTSPETFNGLHWEKKREIILEICGDITDEYIIENDKSLSGLKEILGKHSIENYKKIIADKRSKINKELKGIPDRISENQKSKETIEITLDQAEKSLAEKQKEKTELQEEISKIKSGSKITELKSELIKIDNEKLEHEKSANSNLEKEKMKLTEEGNELKEKYLEVSSEIDQIENDINVKTGVIETLKNDLPEFMEKMKGIAGEMKVKQQEVFPEESKVCVTCGQELDLDKVGELVSDFNIKKSKELESMKKQGSAIKEDYLNTKKIIPEKEKELQELQEFRNNKILEKNKISSEAKNKAQEIAEIDKQIKEYIEPKEFRERKDKINKEITEIKAGQEKVIEDLNNLITPVEEEIKRLNSVISQHGQNEKADKRIAELKTQQKKLSAEYEELEGQLFLTEEFTKTKVEMLEGSINSKFRLAKFKMFNKQVNGGIADTCETTYNGVPYGTNLNAGHKILVGLDIVRTLQEHYGVQAPVFVDNAESLTIPFEMDCQVIKLYAKENVKELKVEVE